VVAPAGGGLAALEVKVDLANARVDANGRMLAIPLGHEHLPPESDVTVEDVAIGQGRHVVHVRVPSHDESGAGGVAWEVILSAIPANASARPSRSCPAARRASSSSGTYAKT
jgi:hypothetical protein